MVWPGMCPARSLLPSDHALHHVLRACCQRATVGRPRAAEAPTPHAFPAGPVGALAEEVGGQAIGVLEQDWSTLGCLSRPGSGWDVGEGTGPGWEAGAAARPVWVGTGGWVWVMLVGTVGRQMG